MTSGPLPYFAYGSNLCVPRLKGRVPGARLLGRALLPGHQLRWHKRSVDGSGKCSIIAAEDPGVVVRGVLFRVPEAERPALDRVEGLGDGYEETTVRVNSAEGERTAWTYVAQATYVDETLKPFVWYRDLVVAGAVSQGFPARYVEELRDVDARHDPDPERAARNREALPCDPSPRPR